MGRSAQSIFVQTRRRTREHRRRTGEAQYPLNERTDNSKRRTNPSDAIGLKKKTQKIGITSKQKSTNARKKERKDIRKNEILKRKERERKEGKKERKKERKKEGKKDRRKEGKKGSSKKERK